MCGTQPIKMPNKHSIRFILLCVAWFGTLVPLKAQVGPQALDCRTAIWTNIQLDQSLPRQWTWTSVLAYSQRSTDTTSNPFAHFGVVGIRQEVSKRLSPHFRFSGGVFYSAIGTGGLSEPNPKYLNELRLYPRVYYDYARPCWRFSAQLRLEVRYLFGPLFEDIDRPFQLRLRSSVRMFVPLDKAQHYTLIFNTELFFPADVSRNEQGNPNVWHTPTLRENRTLLYLRTALSKRVLLDFGAMVQTRLPYQSFAASSAFYLGFGLIVSNPFWLPGAALPEPDHDAQ